jgi:Protein of unknown function (DUF3305)
MRATGGSRVMIKEITKAFKAAPMPASDSVNIGVILERRPVDHPWQDHEWVVAALVPDPPAGLSPEPGPAGQRLSVAGIAALRLHTTEIAAYVENLTSPQASLYAVMRAAEGGDDAPWVLERVTANPYEAQYYINDEDTRVEKAAMPATVRDWLEAYVAENYHEEPFRKRRRDKVQVEAYTFGQEPIASLRQRRKAADGDETS